MILEFTNRLRKCKDSQGGIKNIYLAPYRVLQRSEITFDGASISVFPTTYVYKFELLPGSSFEQKQAENEGGKYYDVNLNVTFNKITLFDNNQFQKLLRKDYFIIVQDNNNNYFLLGFRNGITAEQLNKNITQYTIDFVGQEVEMAPFVNDIIGVDIIIADGENYIFQDDTNFIFQDDTNYIFQ